MSPYVALFFAFEQPEGRDQNKHRAVFALHESLAAGVAKKAKRERIEFIRPRSGFNKRLVHQGGIFTKSPLFQDIQTWVQNEFESVDEAILLKINIPSKDRIDCLKALNRMNINHVSLFPDIDGSSRFCNLQMEIDNY